ncbi:uncharacterized protein LOC115691861 [Syzygium oleosum]|uniref:uncharacterized protein LOC115691861 n=1 Tax=Syzygium oleosum TaxID=219896 RepID=UPI0011D1A14B|nr:uncharacterized protein LOC115691861 [Syzygium oleosum]
MVDSALTILHNFRRWNPKETKSNSVNRNLPVIWQPPRRNALKINTDGSYVSRSPMGAISCLIRDESRVLCDGFARFVRTSSILQLEALALLEGIKHVQERRSEVFEYESDSLEVVNTINSSNQPLWEVNAIILEVRDLLGRLSNVSVAHIDIGANQAANWVGKPETKFSFFGVGSQPSSKSLKFTLF